MNSYTKHTKIIILISAIAVNIVCLLVTANQANATTMSDDNYNIDMGEFNMFAGSSSDNKHRVTVSSGQSAGTSSGANYKVKIGFQNIYPLAPFTFTLTQSQIDFGVLSATNPITRTTKLTINRTPLEGYQVLISEDHPLISPSNSTIPDTTCDNGSCTETTAAEWSNTLTFGFGYRCDSSIGNDCPTVFDNADYYKQFADKSRHEISQVVMSGTQSNQKREVVLTYKVNVSGMQAPGNYSNNVVFIAAPGF